MGTAVNAPKSSAEGREVRTFSPEKPKKSVKTLHLHTHISFPHTEQQLFHKDFPHYAFTVV